MVIKHLLHNAYTANEIKIISRPDIPKLKTRDSNALLKTKKKSLRLSPPGIIMCYHLFSCLAPRSFQDAPITSNLPCRIATRIRLELPMASSNCSRIIIKPMKNQQFLVHRIHGDQAFAP